MAFPRWWCHCLHLLSTSDTIHLIISANMAEKKQISLGSKSYIRQLHLRVCIVLYKHFQVSTSVKYLLPIKLFRPFSYWVFLLFLICKGLKYILNTNTLSGIYVMIIFLWFVLSFHSVRLLMNQSSISVLSHFQPFLLGQHFRNLSPKITKMTFYTFKVLQFCLSHRKSHQYQSDCCTWCKVGVQFYCHYMDYKLF